MKNTVEIIKVVYACNDVYIIQTIVSITSLLCNNVNNKIKIYVIGDNISDENRKKLENAITKYSCEYQYIEIEKILPPDLNISEARHPRTIYAKLFMDMLPETGKLLYLDSDTVVLKGLEDLFSINLGNNLAAGVMMPYSKQKLETRGMSITDFYICDGIVLVNLSKWRAENISVQCIQYIMEWNGNPPMLSEGVLNEVCKGRIKIVHPKFNVMSHMFFFKPAELYRVFQSQDNYYPQEELYEAVKEPVIIHYIKELYERPWCEGSDHPEKERYYKYCDYAEVPQIISTKEISEKTRLLKLMFKVMPFNMFLRLYLFLHGE